MSYMIDQQWKAIGDGCVDAAGNQQIENAPAGITTNAWDYENQRKLVLHPGGQRETGILRKTISSASTTSRACGVTSTGSIRGPAS